MHQLQASSIILVLLLLFPSLTQAFLPRNKQHPSILSKPCLSNPRSPFPLIVVKQSSNTHNVSELKGIERLKRFLEDAAFMGPIRFIIMTDGAILESVGSFEGVKYNNLPGGEYATFASDDKTFEAHINLDKVVSVEMAESKAKKGDHQVYFTRFFDIEGKVLLSSVLHRENEEYDEDGLAWWNKLKGVFGASQQFQ